MLCIPPVFLYIWPGWRIIMVKKYHMLPYHHLVLVMVPLISTWMVDRSLVEMALMV